MRADLAADRRIVSVGGADRAAFLRGLTTNDPREGALSYAALLTPQGKYLADFFMFESGDAALLDVKADLAPALAARLAMYRLRAEVAVGDVDMPVHRGLGDAPDGAFADPRHPSLGWRFYGPLDAEPAGVDWDALRVAACVPESGIELVPNESYILESGFERLNGVDFGKGCYVGQEVTARMKHKTDLRKGLARVSVSGEAEAGAEILADGKPAGRLFTRSGGEGIAYLRFDRAAGEMTAGGARLRRIADGAADGAPDGAAYGA